MQLNTNAFAALDALTERADILHIAQERMLMDADADPGRPLNSVHQRGHTVGKHHYLLLDEQTDAEGTEYTLWLARNGDASPLVLTRSRDKASVERAAFWLRSFYQEHAYNKEHPGGGHASPVVVFD